MFKNLFTTYTALDPPKNQTEETKEVELKFDQFTKSDNLSDLIALS
jgi:hypothetical protein